VTETMRAIRYETLKRYGADEVLADEGLDPAARDAKMRAQAAAWADRFDAHSLLILRKAADRFDTTGRFDRIRAKVLYVIARTDVLFPPEIAPDVMARLKAAGVDAEYFEIDTEYGHTASGADWGKWEAPLRRFLEPLVP
jgi:homoserine O-acetyltransferase